MEKKHLYQKKNSLSEELCKEIIDRFEKGGCGSQGVFADGTVNEDIKKTFDLNISHLDEWKDLDKKLYEILSVELDEYMKSTMVADMVYFPVDIADSGYQIQKYNQMSGFYNWHVDDTPLQKRYIVYMWYLNDVEEGGETEFRDFKIKPERGKLVMFPATWEWPHRANAPITSAKYICTGWIVKNSEIQ